MSKLSEPAIAVIIAVGILYVIGLLCIYATEIHRDAWPRNTTKQIIHLMAAMLVSTVILRLGYGFFMRYAYIIFIIGVLSLIPLVLARYIPFGSIIPYRRGAYRWINLPFFQFQPSEFMKIAYIIGLAAYLRFRQNYRTFPGLLIPLLGSLVPMILILLEPDLGTVLLIMPVLFMMLFAAGARIKHFVLLAVVALAVSPVMWMQLHAYQRGRILGVILQSEEIRQQIIEEPEKYAFLGTPQQAREWKVGIGMQLDRSKAALGSGGITGNGWGSGTFVEYNFLPDKHNDFIFAIVGHQWGLIGCLLVLSCYVIIVLAGLEIAANTAEPFARLLVIGVVALISAQVVINVGMTIGLMPITGMTLPFVSYGGSSLLTNFMGAALLISVSRHRPYILADRPFEYDRGVPPDTPVKPAPSYRTHT